MRAIVIMAGGSGTRFWPLSRKSCPKQLLPLGTGSSLLADTLERAKRHADVNDIYVVTTAALADKVAECLPELPRANILAEPVGKNTAPCIAWAAAHVRAKSKVFTMAVLPADHAVGRPDDYAKTMALAFESAERGALTTIGVKPTRAETGYGYIEHNGKPDVESTPVKRFVEKPNAELAAEYLAAGNYLWNSGQFFFSSATIEAAYQSHLPEMHQLFFGKTFDVAEVYGRVPSISFDYGIMEKASGVHVVEGDYGWTDLGSYESVWELQAGGASENVVHGDAVVIDSSGSFVDARAGRLVAVVGAQDFIIVDTKDALLVIPKSRAQDVKKVVEELQRRKLDQLL